MKITITNRHSDREMMEVNLISRIQDFKTFRRIWASSGDFVDALESIEILSERLADHEVIYERWEDAPMRPMGSRSLPLTPDDLRSIAAEYEGVSRRRLEELMTTLVEQCFTHKLDRNEALFCAAIFICRRRILEAGDSIRISAIQSVARDFGCVWEKVIENFCADGWIQQVKAKEALFDAICADQRLIAFYNKVGG